MADFQPAPTQADVILVDEKTQKPTFNPLWLNWFLGLVGVLNAAGGTALDHNELDGLQGGTTNQYYHLTQAQHAAVASLGTFTEGSVIFAGPSGVLAQDNANFFWDDTNNRLGIGTNAPTVPLDVVGVITSRSRIELATTVGFPGAVTNRAREYYSSANGYVMYGAGSTFDLLLANRNGNGVFGIHQASINSSFFGQLRVGSSAAPSGTESLEVTGSFRVSNNTTLGDAAADTLTINAGTWTIGNAFTWTRAVGVAAAGQVNAQIFALTFDGNAAGTTDMRSFRYTSTGSGATNIASQFAGQYLATFSGAGNITNTLAAGIYTGLVNGGGTVATILGLTAGVAVASLSVATLGAAYRAIAPTTGTGAITTNYAFYAQNQGNVNITTTVGLKIDDFTNSTTMRGIQSSLSSGSGKANLYIDGTADNLFAGNVRIGSVVAPTVALDVTGAALISTTLGVTGNVTATADLAVNGGDITSSATTFNLLNATVTTLNIGGAATTLAMGAGAASSATLAFTTGIALNTAAITSNQTTVALLNATATTINFAGGASAALNIGNSAGLATVAGPLRSVGNFDVNTNKFTVTASNGNTLVAGTLNVTGITTLNNKIYPATDAAATQSACGIYATTGAPNNANGADGDICFRADGGALSTIYQRRAGAWIGVL